MPDLRACRSRLKLHTGTTNNIRVTYEYIRVLTSTYKFIRVTNEYIRVTYEYIRVTYGYIPVTYDHICITLDHPNLLPRSRSANETPAYVCVICSLQLICLVTIGMIISLVVNVLLRENFGSIIYSHAS